MLFTSYSLFRLSLATSIFLFVISLTSACTQRPESNDSDPPKDQDKPKEASEEQIKLVTQRYRKERDQRVQKHAALIKKKQSETPRLSDDSIASEMAKTWCSDMFPALINLSNELGAAGCTATQIQNIGVSSNGEEIDAWTNIVDTCTSLSKAQATTILTEAIKHYDA